VVNYDLPNVPEDYVHRIGRTGRAGATGEAVSLVCIDEAGFLRDIERLIKREIPSVVVPGFEPDPHAKAEPIQLRSPGHRPAGGRGRPGQGQGRVQGQGKSQGQGRSQGQGQSKTGGQGKATAAAPSQQRRQGTPLGTGHNKPAGTKRSYGRVR
jgi:ATP-dependent RNA helicase RhlE